VGCRRHRRPAPDTADSPAEEGTPGAADTPAQAGSTAPKARLPTPRARSGAARPDPPGRKTIPPPPPQTWNRRRNQPRKTHIQDHRRKKMTNLLINPD